MESYGRKTGIWNEIYSEYQAVDLRNTDLAVEPGFDNCLREFGEKTSYVLDFGCRNRGYYFSIYPEFSGEKRRWNR